MLNASVTIAILEAPVSILIENIYIYIYICGMIIYIYIYNVYVYVIYIYIYSVLNLFQNLC